jgi:ribosomal protein L4
MNKLVKRLALTLILSLTSTTSFAATTDEVLAACDKALNAKINEANLCNLGVQLRSNEIDRLAKENAELRSRNSAWYNSAALWAAVGVIVGVYAGARAAR